MLLVQSATKYMSSLVRLYFDGTSKWAFQILLNLRYEQNLTDKNVCAKLDDALIGFYWF